jgi:hypothetical protein
MKHKIALIILNIVQATMHGCSPIIAVFGVVLIILPIISLLVSGQSTVPIPSQEQSKSEYQIEELEKRIDSIEQIKIAFESIEHRLTVLETLQEHESSRNDSPWQRGTSVGTGLLLVEAAFRLGSRRYAISVQAKPDKED